MKLVVSCLAVLLALLLAGSGVGCGPGDATLVERGSGLAAETPHVLFLNYAPTGGCPWTPGIDRTTCLKSIQTFLDEWYADFNIVFTTVQPSGHHYKMDITWEGDGGRGTNWCEAVPNPETFNAYGRCRYSSKSCAGIIAAENGHNVGLDLTTEPTDLEYSSPGANANCGYARSGACGWADKDAPTVSPMCRKVQNSYRQMLLGLGKWPGGCKPGPFGEYCPKGATGGAAGSGAGGGGGGGGNSGGAGGGSGGAAGSDGGGAGNQGGSGGGVDSGPGPIGGAGATGVDAGGGGGGGGTKSVGPPIQGGCSLPRSSGGGLALLAAAICLALTQAQKRRKTKSI